MDEPGRDEIHLSRVNLHIPQCPAYPVLSDGALKLLPRAVLLQTENELRALVRPDYVPHLSLPELALVLQRVVVGRVNLYRQLIPRVDELYEQRETVGVIVLSDKPVSALFKIVSEGHVLVYAVIYDVHSVRSDGQLPALRDIRERRGLVVFFLQLVPAPDYLFYGGTQSHRVKFHFVQVLSIVYQPSFFDIYMTSSSSFG